MTFPLWLFLVAAAAIAAAAFASAQIIPGLGMVVAAAGSAIWSVYVGSRARRGRTNG